MRPSLRQLPLHPLLLAAYAVLFLYGQNVQLVRTSEVASPLGWSILGAALVLVVAALVLRDLARGAVVASALVVAFFGYGHLARLADDPPAELLVAFWLIVIAAATVVAIRLRDSRAAATVGLNAVSFVLVVFALSTIMPHLLQPSAQARAQAGDAPPSGLTARRATQRDIYYLVFDRYGSQSALAPELGITDNDLPGWLAERGFQIVPNAHANYVRTTLSLASALNMEHLDRVAARQGPTSTDYGPLYTMLQEHQVGRFLREQGYRYFHIGSWYNPTRTFAVANESFEPDTTTEFEAVLYETTALPLLASALPQPEEMPPEDEKHVVAARFQFRVLHRLMGESGPKFVMAHVLLPHDPYTFDEEGNYVSPAARRGVPVGEQFRAQLEYTNLEIRRIVDRLLARPESERPIIIIQADEGPYPQRYFRDQAGFDWETATIEELEMKFGILSAFYLPEEPGIDTTAYPVYDTMTPVNTFRLVLGRYFGLDLPYLPDTVHSSRSPQLPYDLTDVTERLPTR